MKIPSNRNPAPRKIQYMGYEIEHRPKLREPWVVSRMFGWIHTTHKTLTEAKQYIRGLRND